MEVKDLKTAIRIFDKYGFGEDFDISFSNGVLHGPTIDEILDYDLAELEDAGWEYCAIYNSIVHYA